MSNQINIMELLHFGFKTSQLKGKVIANNLANLDTPEYRRKAVRFEQLLSRALNSSGDLNLEKLEPELFEPRTTSVNAEGNDVNLDTEVGEMIKNSVRYKTYIRLLNRMYKQMDLAIMKR